MIEDMKDVNVLPDSTGNDDSLHPETENLTVPTHTNKGARNYKCPVCGGEFNSWETKYYKYDGKGNIRESMSRSGVEKDHCPFCGLEKMEYKEDGDTE